MWTGLIVTGMLLLLLLDYDNLSAIISFPAFFKFSTISSKFGKGFKS